MKIRKLQLQETPPYTLLLLADPSRVLIEAYLQQGDCYVCEGKDEIIGTYVIVKLNDETTEIKNVAVREDLQGRGIGKKLLLDALRTAKASGSTTVEIGTGNSSIGQLALYQKCGFRISGVVKDFFVNQYEERIFENDIQCRDMIRLEISV
ncbi:GNAT family N-acetyltransferase [Sporosarcina sp. OR05]|uniref:GNAT family N-acetyltransferase n=1 Tax=Sporosarcina sp. OR05 TaxID=2969819 RepID=UPI00352A85F3